MSVAVWPRDLAPARPGRRRQRFAVLALVALATCVAVTTVVAATSDIDHPPDVAGFLRVAAGAFSGLTWPLVTCLLAASALHYLAATVAARAAAGVPLKLGELCTAQFVAAAANRITPAGLGGAGVLGRYLNRRGRLDGAQSTAAVTALSVLGGLADALTFSALVGVGVLFHLTGAAAEVPLLLSRFTRVIPLPTGMLLWALLAAAVTSAAVIAHPRVRTCERARRMLAALRSFRTGLLDLLRHPARVSALMGASAATTASLAAGFAAAAVIGPTNLPAAGFGALMIGYMVASAAANALPTPGGVGTADAALTGVLLAAGAPAPSALATVLAFRVITFWAPAIAGLPLARVLRRRGAL